MNLIDILNSFGFPIFVCVWFLIRIETVINNNTKALYELQKEIIKIKKN